MVMTAPPPGATPNLARPPPSMAGPPPGGQYGQRPPFTGHSQGYGHRMMGGYQPRFPQYGHNQPRPHHRPQQNQSKDSLNTSGENPDDFDGKKPRKSMMRKTVDYNSAFMAMLEARVWQRDHRDRRAVQPDVCYVSSLMPPTAYGTNAANAVATKFVKTATNKMRCPVFTLAWTPEGRRLITGASSGEFTLWNGLTFNFETILQAHDSPVRAMVWSHNDTWMVTGDHAGFIKYWQSNMNNVKMFQAHKEPVRCVTFSPTDHKFASCSDDGTVRVWDFLTCTEEKVLRGHGSDVKCVDWHPTKGLLASGSKDNQQPVKIWDPRSGKVMATLHAHKNTVMDIEWNRNGNWLLTASRDHLLKLFDIRNSKEELQTFRGHKKEAACLAWHPIHEGLFASGGSDGAIMYWNVGADKEVGVIEAAHESIVWSLAWHPIGHILCSGSNDHTCKFWTRNRPGDTMRDKYNLDTLPAGMEEEPVMGVTASEAAVMGVAIPGMAPEDRVESGHAPSTATPTLSSEMSIPGLDPDDSGVNMGVERAKKVPYAKPIPKSFVNSWNTGEVGGAPVQAPPPMGVAPPPTNQQQEGCIPLHELQRQATAVVAFGNVYPVLPGSSLARAIMNGENALKEVLRSEFLPSG